jgi:Uncharacterized conserved protein
MSFQRHAGILLCAGLAALVAIATGCGKRPAPTPAPVVSQVDPVYGHLLHAQPKLPTIQIKVGGNELTAEVARKQVEIATGMMFRTNMLENEGMLFVFPRPGKQSFYMKNCFVPLSGAYINPAGEIMQIIQMQPHNEIGIWSYTDDIQFVLEVPQGWFERHNVGVGAVVTTERGSLQETFFGSNPFKP